MRTCLRRIRLDDRVLREARNKHDAKVTRTRHIGGLEREEGGSGCNDDDYVRPVAAIKRKHEVRDGASQLGDRGARYRGGTR